MRLYFDVDIKKLVQGIGQRDQVSQLEFKRGDSSRIEVQFVSGTTVQELTEPATGIFGIKEADQYDADYIVSDVSWTKEGSGTSTLYVFEPNFNTTELNNLLGHDDANTANDKVFVDAMLEIEVTENGAIYSTQRVTARLHNDVVKGSEGSPTGAPGVDQMIADRAVCYDRAQTLTNSEKEQAHANMGWPAYDDLTAANTALGAGKPYYDRALEGPNISTA